MPVDPVMSVSGVEWQMPALEAPTQNPPVEGPGFGQMLSGAVASLTESQQQAAEASRALAAGETSDPTAVVMAVERAQLAMQLAGQIRTKAVEAAQDIFHTQV